MPCITIVFKPKRVPPVLKEDHERERLRWQQKLDEVEEKLAEAAINNSELAQVKAELNRKIVDFEKNQRPLIEQNRRLSDRNRILNNEIKKLEERLSHSRDDFLSLRDSYDRLCKENSSLKEQRVFPEKLDELEQTRARVLEYSKCITALRQSALEKDRRYELLVQRFKKLKRCVASSKRTGLDDDNHSCIGSEGSMDSSMLDTITEDLDEDLLISPIVLPAELSPIMTATEYGLSEQLSSASATIAEMQRLIDSQSDSLRDDDERIRTLESELANAQEQNDLLEFQLVELTENAQAKSNVRTVSTYCQTDESTSDIESEDEEEILSRLNLTPEAISRTSKDLEKVRTTSFLSAPDRKAVRHGVECIVGLSNKMEFYNSKLNMMECELKRLERQKADEIAELQQKLDEEESAKQRKKKQLQAEIEQLKKQKADEARRTSQQIRDLMETQEEMSKYVATKTARIEQLVKLLKESTDANTLQRSKSEAQEQVVKELEEELQRLRMDYESCATERDALQAKLSELQKRLGGIEADIASEGANIGIIQKQYDLLSEEKEKLASINQQLHAELSEAQAQIEKLREQIRPIGSQLERRYEEARYRLSEALRMLEEANERMEEMQQQQGHEKCLAEIKQLKTYNQELEEQFNSQMEIITALKKKFILLQGKASSTDSVGWTSNSSDGANSMDEENYHSEESSEGGSRKKP
ncbi:Protein C14H10.2 a [Aphelenchoides avenae]|nr:Protein C14H10.2 a [Aphelenchus avenae]